MDATSKNKLQIIFLGFSLFVLVLILVLNLTSLPETNPKVATLNYTTSTKTLSEQSLANLEQSFAVFAQAHYPEAYQTTPKFTISIRPDSFKQCAAGDGEKAAFIIDVEELKMTYNVEMSLMDKAIAVFTCPSPGLMKYPSVTCFDLEESELTE